MSWRTEFGEEYEVPTEVRRLTDVSYKNDEMPSFTDDATDGDVDIRLWVDLPSARSRYTVTSNVAEDVVTAGGDERVDWYDGGDIHTALAWLAIARTWVDHDAEGLVTAVNNLSRPSEGHPEVRPGVRPPVKRRMQIRKKNPWKR